MLQSAESAESVTMGPVINSSTIHQAFHRYAALIRDMLRPRALPVEEETARAVHVERGEVLAAAVLDPSSVDAAPMDRLVAMGREPAGLPGAVVIDRHGHRRGVYRPLLVYAWLQSYRLLYETLPALQFGQWEESLRAWCDELEHSLNGAPADDAMPAAAGAAVAEAAWAAATLHLAGKVFIRDAWTDLASHFFGRLARAQQPRGAFLMAGSADNPETHWYHELVILHAAASHAVQSENRPLAAAVARNTEFHLNETQPDHATNQPWGVFAFIWNQRTHSLADQLLHTASVQAPHGVGGLPAILLADALLCLRLFDS
jgi:hypothetical protein